MKKKSLIALLIISLLNITGCYSNIEIMKAPVDNYLQYEKENGKPEEIFVYANDSLKYHFGAWGVRIEMDTLYGNGTRVLSDKEIPFKGEIPIDKINAVEWGHKSTEIETLTLVISLTTAAIFFVLLSQWKPFHFSD